MTQVDKPQKSATRGQCHNARPTVTFPVAEQTSATVVFLGRTEVLGCRYPGGGGHLPSHSRRTVMTQYILPVLGFSHT